MRTGSIPRWVRLAAALVVIAQAAVLIILPTGKLQGPARNIVPEVLIGGFVALAVLAAHVWRFHAEAIPPAPARIGVLLLVLVAAALVTVYFYSIRPILGMRYDLASWSEPMMVLDIIKLRTGAHFYLAPDDSNSNVYTPGASTATYFLAWLLRRPTSIPFYRLLQQFYLGLAALFTAAAAGNLLRLAAPGRFPRVPRAWLVFFALASFLLATNPQTNTFNVYLHNDPFSLWVSSVAFWLLTRYAVTRRSLWLWLMAGMPALGFLVKQYLAIWAAVYIVYLWLSANSSFRKVVSFGVGCFGLVGATVGLCLLVWGDPFRYWTFEVMGTHVVSFVHIADRFADAAWCLALGLLGGWILLREKSHRDLLGVWVGWLVMMLAGFYTSGVAFHPTHLGSATMVAGCFSLAALAIVWPDPSSAALPPAWQWFRMVAGFLLTLAVFAGLGSVHRPDWRVSPDLSRYATEIEQEFEGLPTERVLLDLGDWVYLRHGVLMKDRQPILTTHRKPHYGLLERVRRQEYARILVHELSNGDYAYDLGGNRGIRDAILASYHEVRRIPRVRGMENWLYTGLTMTDIVVLEPTLRSETSVSARLAVQGNTK